MTWTRFALSATLIVSVGAGCTAPSAVAPTPTASDAVMPADDPPIATTQVAPDAVDCSAVAAAFTGSPSPKPGTLDDVSIQGGVTLPEATCVIDFGSALKNGVIVYNGDRPQIIAELTTSLETPGWDFNGNAMYPAWQWSKEEDAVDEFEGQAIHVARDEQLDHWIDEADQYLFGPDPVLVLTSLIPGG